MLHVATTRLPSWSLLAGLLVACADAAPGVTAPGPKPAAGLSPVEESTSAPTMLTGGAVVLTSKRDGLPQLYVGDVQHPKDAPRRLPTPPNEQVRSAVLSADERSVLFASDVGNDNKFRI